MGTTKHNYSDEHDMAEWFPGITNLQDRGPRPSHLFHFDAEIKEERVRHLKH